MKIILLSLLAMFVFAAYSTANAQDDSKNVSITVSGSGKTLDDAKQAALRSAIEQAYGSFISTKTEIFNDQVVADQMASVSSGNIQSYNMLNQSQLPDGTWGVTLKAIVSVDKLTSFIEAKGIAIEIKGGMFALNIKQQLLNEQGEIKAISEMVGLLHEPMQISFDYVIKSSDPKSVDTESKNWIIPLVVTATSNKNMGFCANYFIKTLAALSLTPPEVESYQSLNKIVLPVYINYNGQTQTFYLRKQTSISIIQTLIRQWEFYVRGFSVLSGIDQSKGNGEGQFFRFSDYRGPQNKGTSVSFLSSGMIAGTFSWDDKRTLDQIEQMTGYSVMPTEVRSQFKHGGFVVYEKNGHGLVAAVTDLDKRLRWTEAKTACDDLVLNGYNDWYLPTRKDLDALYNNLKTRNIGGFANANNSGFPFNYYWSSSDYEQRPDWAYRLDFTNGEDAWGNRSVKEETDNKSFVRAVRSF